MLGASKAYQQANEQIMSWSYTPLEKYGLIAKYLFPRRL
jgi:hypothetical protein